jgi:hypothetical protein
MKKKVTLLGWVVVLSATAVTTAIAGHIAGAFVGLFLIMCLGSKHQPKKENYDGGNWEPCHGGRSHDRTYCGDLPEVNKWGDPDIR